MKKTLLILVLSTASVCGQFKPNHYTTNNTPTVDARVTNIVNSVLVDSPFLGPLIKTNFSRTFNYEAFPAAATSFPDRSEIYTIFRRAPAHGITNSDIAFSKSIDSGFSFTTPVSVITNAGFDSRNYAFGTTWGNRILSIYQRVNVATSSVMPPMVVASDTAGDSWFELGEISTNSFQFGQGTAAHGPITTVGSRVYAALYNYTGTNSAAYAIFTDNKGTNWVSSFVTTNRGPTEPWLLPINENVALMAVRELHTSNNFWFYWTVDRGTNWISGGSPGITNLSGANGVGASFPCALSLVQTVEGPRIQMTWADRSDRILYVSSALASQVFTNAKAITAQKRAIGIIAASSNQDGGYVGIAQQSQLSQEYMIFIYFAEGAGIDGPAEIRMFRSSSGGAFASRLNSQNFRIIGEDNTLTNDLLYAAGADGVAGLRFTAPTAVPTVRMAIMDDGSANHIARVSYRTGYGLTIGPEGSTANQGAAFNLSATNNPVFGNAGGMVFNAAYDGNIIFRIGTSSAEIVHYTTNGVRMYNRALVTPTGAMVGANNAFLWVSNGVLFVTTSKNGSTVTTTMVAP